MPITALSSEPFFITLMLLFLHPFLPSHIHAMLGTQKGIIIELSRAFMARHFTPKYLEGSLSEHFLSNFAHRTAAWEFQEAGWLAC